MSAACDESDSAAEVRCEISGKIQTDVRIIVRVNHGELPAVLSDAIPIVRRTCEGRHERIERLVHHPPDGSHEKCGMNDSIHPFEEAERKCSSEAVSDENRFTVHIASILLEMLQPLRKIRMIRMRKRRNDDPMPATTQLRGKPRKPVLLRTAPDAVEDEDGGDSEIITCLMSTMQIPIIVGQAPPPRGVKGKALLRSSSPTRRPRILGGVDEEAQGLRGGALAAERFLCFFLCRPDKERSSVLKSLHTSKSSRLSISPSLDRGRPSTYSGVRSFSTPL